VDRDDERAFEDWYRAQHRTVLATLTALCGRPELAADATDEAFARALLHWRRVSAMASPGGWLYRVALNELRRLGRRAGREPATGAAPDQPAPEAVDPDHEIWTAVDALPDRQRIAVVLRYVADLPEADVAAAMKVRRGTVASTLAAARRRLAAVLGPDLDPSEVLDEPIA
jgi:RNA polymerase sigma-70 factor (ECF subfamily)